MEKKPKSDPLRNIKAIGYAMAFRPLQGSTTLADLVRHAKFRLCSEKRLLMHDPIWDTYTDEQILVEFYALTFTQDSEAKALFEAGINGMLDDGKGSNSKDAAVAWMDAMIAKNQTAVALATAPAPSPEDDKIKEFSELEDGFEFTPPGKR